MADVDTGGLSTLAGVYKCIVYFTHSRQVAKITLCSWSVIMPRFQNLTSVPMTSIILYLVSPSSSISSVLTLPPLLT